MPVMPSGTIKLRGNLPIAELQRQARAQGYVLVRRGKVANWHPILLELIRGHRLVYAIKLWREVTGLDLISARLEIEAVCSLNANPPDGTEYPDLPNDRLDLVKPGDRRVGRRAYYDEPWREKLTAQDAIDAAAVHAAEVRAARRRLGRHRLSGEYDRSNDVGRP